MSTVHCCKNLVILQYVELKPRELKRKGKRKSERQEEINEMKFLRSLTLVRQLDSMLPFFLLFWRRIADNVHIPFEKKNLIHSLFIKKYRAVNVKHS